jgi:hypothetical protein
MPSKPDDFVKFPSEVKQDEMLEVNKLLQRLRYRCISTKWSGSEQQYSCRFVSPTGEETGYMTVEEMWKEVGLYDAYPID